MAWYAGGRDHRLLIQHLRRCWRVAVPGPAGSGVVRNLPSMALTLGARGLIIVDVDGSVPGKLEVALESLVERPHLWSIQRSLKS